MIVDGKVTSPPCRRTIVAVSTSMRHDFTDIVRPFLNTTISAEADLGNNKEPITNNKQTTPWLALRLLFVISSLLFLIE